MLYPLWCHCNFVVKGHLLCDHAYDELADESDILCLLDVQHISYH